MNSGRCKNELPKLKVSHFNNENIYCLLLKNSEQVKTKGKKFEEKHFVNSGIKKVEQISLSDL